MLEKTPYFLLLFDLSEGSFGKWSYDPLAKVDNIPTRAIIHTYQSQSPSLILPEDPDRPA
jgi:hypothetical protein